MRITLVFLLICVLALACKKNKNTPTPASTTTTTTDSNNADNPDTNPSDTPTTVNPPTPPPPPPPPPKDTFITYLITKGNNYCDGNSYPTGTWTTLRFRAILDSSCIYTTVLPENQLDINKLYGISDCSSFHQTNSARFGWNWVGGAMRIHAYCYANGTRNYKELGTVDVNKAFECKLTVLPDKYLFELNGKTDTMQRGCNTSSATGYKLLPYFGGDEPAPQDVRVKIQEY